MAVNNYAQGLQGQLNNQLGYSAQLGLQNYQSQRNQSQTMSFTQYTSPNQALDIRYNAIESMNDIAALIRQRDMENKPIGYIELTNDQFNELRKDPQLLANHQEGTVMSVFGYELRHRERDD